MGSPQPTLPTIIQERRKEPRSEVINPNGQQLNASWDQVHHSNGATYFCHRETGVITPISPQEQDNAAALQIAAHKIHGRLAQRGELDRVRIVVDFTDGIGPSGGVSYYLVNDERQKVFWFEDLEHVAVTLGHDDHCLCAFLLEQYWIHAHHFPPATVNVAAEGEILVRLNACGLQGNENLSPWTSDQCRHHIEAVELNRRTKSGPDRMADLGLLWSAIYHEQHESLHGRNHGRNARHRNGDPVAFVARRHQQQPGWSRTVQILINCDYPLAIIVAYSVLLTGVNKSVGQERVFNDLLFLVSLEALTATLLLCVFSPGLYEHTAARVFEDNPASAAPFRNWALTSILAFDAFVYGCILSAFGRDLDPPEHQISMAGLVLVTFVLALPPAFHALKLTYDL